MPKSLALTALVLFAITSKADEAIIHQSVIDAAKAAEQALSQAEKAHQASSAALDAARQAAENANRMAEQAYLQLRAIERESRVQALGAAPKVPETDYPVNNPIDAFIAVEWPEGSKPRLSSDEAFIRRAFLDVVGYIPEPEEVISFIEDNSPDKRTKLIDDLLARDEDYAIHWSQFWEDALCSNGKHQGGVGTRANFQPFIIESFKENKPYDVFVAQLIDPNLIGYYGGYVKSKDHLESTQTAANIGQVFMGTRMKCASCHDHFLNFEWTQKRFLGFASFFSEEDLEVIRCEVKKGEFVEPSFIFDNGEVDAEALDSYEKRLAAAAKLIVDPANPRFAASFVNRVWKRCFGLGLVEPVDDFREDTPPSHPRLLEWLSHEFAANGYDVKHIMRMVLNSRTYQLEFNTELADVWIDGKETPRYFRSPAHRRLTCEQMLDSVAVAMGLEERKRTSHIIESTPLTRSLGRPETRNEVMTLRSDEVAVIQSLQLMNSPEFHEMIYDSPLPARLAKTYDEDEALRLAYLRVLNREPAENERDTIKALLGDDPSADEWGDVLWALAASPQFQFIH